MQIHIEKNIRVFFLRTCRGRPEESSITRLEDSGSRSENNSVQRAAVALRRVQENLIWQRGGCQVKSASLVQRSRRKHFYL